MIVDDILRIEDIENEKYELMCKIFDYKVYYKDAENEIKELEKRISFLNREKDKLVVIVRVFIQSIDDEKVREIIERRAIKRQTWERIGYALNMDRRTASRKYYRALKGMEYRYLRKKNAL